MTTGSVLIQAIKCSVKRFLFNTERLITLRKHYPLQLLQSTSPEKHKVHATVRWCLHTSYRMQCETTSFQRRALDTADEALSFAVTPKHITQEALCPRHRPMMYGYSFRDQGTDRFPPMMRTRAHTQDRRQKKAECVRTPTTQQQEVAIYIYRPLHGPLHISVKRR